ncbi:peptidase family C50-domain-containing protein [Cytidiella melzeri]|nr:peptidase family C50-domain-containing protein [Cytidiella melzeri]
MRVVNSASKNLSTIVETGWKRSNGGQHSSSRLVPKPGSSKPDAIAFQVDACSRTIREGLCALREYRPGDIDVERAACSAVGKMIAIDSYQSAMLILQDMLPALRSSYPSHLSTSDNAEPSLPDELETLSLPLPNAAPPLDDVLMTLLTTYLLHTLTTITWIRFSRLSDMNNFNVSLSQFAHAIHTFPTLLQWLPYLRDLTPKYLDSTLTRAYTALTRSSSLYSTYGKDMAHDVYRIRLYGLLLLLGTSPAALKPNMFWEQTVKFTVAFIKCVANVGSPPSLEAKGEVTNTVLSAYDDILTRTLAREDQAVWMSGHAFVAFCEYWMDFARRAEDTDTLQKVSQLIRLATSSERQSEVPAMENENASGKVSAVIKAVTEAEPYLVIAFSTSHDDPALLKAGSKVWRALERLRRAASKAFEILPSSGSTNGEKYSTETITQCAVVVIAKILTLVCSKFTAFQVETGHAELLTSSLDSLFTLAKSTLNVSRATSINQAFDWLSDALSLVTTTRETSLKLAERANFLRCISGVFHNLGATLYQAGHHSHAVRFFEQSCPVSEDALKMHDTALVDVQVTPDRDDQWASLEDQLHRRWEILGVCQSKTGDRKGAFSAFRSCIRTFPFHVQAFVKKTALCSNATLFDDSPSTKHIATVIDRMTYMGICDLFLPAEEVSLKAQRIADVSDSESNAVLGALLERQAEGLDSSKWKPAVHNAICRILQDALEVYPPQNMPVRRARVMLKCFELTSSTAGKGMCLVDDVEKFALEADTILQAEDLGLDAGLSEYCGQYRAAFKLWMAHSVHQQPQAPQSSRIVSYVEEACSILKRNISPMPRQSLGKTVLPTAGKGQTARKATGKRQATARAAPARTRGRIAKVAVTPKPRKCNQLLPLPILSFGPPPALEYASTLLDLLHSTAHLLGLLGQVVMKVQVLLIGRRISEHHPQSRSDDYVQFSTELAHEYVNLGKTGKAANIYNLTWNAMNNLRVTEETRVLFLLRYSESLIAMGNVLKSSASYTEAYSIAQGIEIDERSLSSVQRILTRASLLERAAVAATTFSLIQYTRDDPVASINGMLQSLRLWNRAFDTLSRLAPPSSSAKKPGEGSDNPFFVEAQETPAPNAETAGVERFFQRLPALRGIGWRILEGLLSTLFSLTRAYVSRGSPREAEFFAQQAKDLAVALNMPAMVSRALSRLGEIYLHLGQLKDSHACLAEAANLVADAGGPDAADIRRLHADHSRLNANKEGAQQLYDEAIAMLEELDQQFTTIDGHALGPRKPNGLSPKAQPTSSHNDTLAPSLLLSILRQNIWMLHGEGGEYQQLLERLRTLPPTAEIKAEESALMAKLKLEDVYARFQADMFLSSLAESAITLPMGMKRQTLSISPSTQEILTILSHAEKLFWADLTLVAKRGNVFHVRDAAVSLALIRAFQDTLGKTGTEGPALAACLLDKSTSITLRREVLEVVQYKIRDNDDFNDLQWPLITLNGSPMSPPKPRKQTRFTPFDSDDEDEPSHVERNLLAEYWKTLATKYQDQPYDVSHLSGSQVASLPPNWTVVSISVTEDKNTMFVTRQCANKDPLVFYIPLKERRESEVEEYLSFDDALVELREIIRLSDEGTKEAANVKNNRDARAAWWASRSALDKRLKQLLENIEFCWLGAFKTILSPPRHVPDEALQDLRFRFERVFDRSIVIRDKRQRTSVRLDDALLECFACLSPKARDEELEDVIYFILDLYQFHGIPIATAEVDVDQVVIDFRSALEDHMAKYRSQIVPQEDSHLFLVLDKNVQGIPWESIPVLRGQSVSRIPSVDFLLDRLQYTKNVQMNSGAVIDRFSLNPRETFFVLNPSGDLKNTEGRFANWLQDMKKVGWTGSIGKVPSELQFSDALMNKDLVIYFGHGGAEQYIRSRKVRHLPKCAATMLWGCSSGALKEMGDFDRTGTPYNYMLAGCPTLVANLWDVTDRDIDKFSQSVFDKIHLTADVVKAWQPDTECHRDRTSIVAAVARSRDACKLKYLTGAAPIIYGIPFYL